MLHVWFKPVLTTRLQHGVQEGEVPGEGGGSDRLHGRLRGHLLSGRHKGWVSVY